MQLLIYHPAAIGDVVLATPVARRLKEHFADCRVVHMTHPSLFPLLQHCPYIDELVPAQGSIPQQRAAITSRQPQYLINLSGSLKSKLITLGSAPHVVHYKKQVKLAPPMMHAVENFLQTLAPWKIAQNSSLTFPTISVNDHPLSNSGKNISILPGGIAFAPGVGAFRPHRSWAEDRWAILGNTVINQLKRPLYLVGGEAETDLCARLAANIGQGCMNLAGQLSLPETADALSQMDVLVSGDTGPAHIAVAVGTRVVGLYGPTFAERSGPYGPQNRILSATANCQCLQSKQCKLKPGSGLCMDQISCDSTYELLLATSAEAEAAAKSTQ